ncbi:hypothetical protein GJ496_005847 [Pomphorhynchus laevis]|nr:hypothetical protein GJ496_005847 [Pomphorhynchus laevis]
MINDITRQLITLPLRHCGLGISDPSEKPENEYIRSMRMCETLLAGISGNELRHQQYSLASLRMAEKDHSHMENWQILLLTSLIYQSRPLQLDAARYNWMPPNCPLVCACGENFSVRHALACQTGGLPIVRHNVVRDFLSGELTKVGCTVTVEPRVALKSAIRNGLQYGECIQRLRTALSFKLAKMASTCIKAARTRNPEHRKALM